MDEKLKAVCDRYIAMVNEYVDALYNEDIERATDIRINHLKPLEKVLRNYELYKGVFG